MASSVGTREKFIGRISSTSFVLVSICVGVLAGTASFLIVGIIATILDAAAGILTLFVFAAFLAGFVVSVVLLKRARNRNQGTVKIAPSVVLEQNAVGDREIAGSDAAVSPKPKITNTQSEIPNNGISQSKQYWTTKKAMGLAAVGGVVAFVYTFISDHPPSGNTASRGELPVCDSNASTNSLKQMIVDSPQSKQLNLKVFAIKEAKEVNWDPANQVRRCSATVYSNAGSEPMFFKIYWIDRSKGEYFFETGLF